jgi:2-keto-4-pentenoate hydratase
MPLSAVVQAGRLLAAARRDGKTLQGLPAECRPVTQGEAEAVQIATFAALGHAIGGWKVGRAGGLVFAAPMPVLVIVEAPVTLPPMPSGARVELELALRLRRAIPLAELAALDLDSLPAAADLVPLIEIVRSRWAPDAPVGPVERIADCISNQFAVVGAPLGPWERAMVDALAARLSFNGMDVAAHSGPHPAAPLEELLEAWRARCRTLGHAPRAGEVVTLGTLTGILPLPAPGTEIRGLVLGRGEILCCTAPTDGA